MAVVHQHPYYPTDVVLDGYQPQALDFTFILGVFFGGAIAVMLGIWVLSGAVTLLCRVLSSLCAILLSTLPQLTHDDCWQAA